MAEKVPCPRARLSARTSVPAHLGTSSRIVIGPVVVREFLARADPFDTRDDPDFAPVAEEAAIGGATPVINFGSDTSPVESVDVQAVAELHDR